MYVALQVNKDFGEIFSTLLPGAHAKLVPIPSPECIDGLEIRVAFGGVWKDSLSELSGGQRCVGRVRACVLFVCLFVVAFSGGQRLLGMSE